MIANDGIEQRGLAGTIGADQPGDAAARHGQRHGVVGNYAAIGFRHLVAKAKRLEADPTMKDFNTMMVKTHLSLTHDPTRKGVPKGWILPVRDVLIFAGAKFLCPMTGTISLMPGTSSDPAYRRVDVDVNTGKVTGLF